MKVTTQQSPLTALVDEYEAKPRMTLCLKPRNNQLNPQRIPLIPTRTNTPPRGILAYLPHKTPRDTILHP